MKNKKIELFSESSLVILVSVVTLLLQLISFATTWNGSKIYLEGVFPYASLLFAIAIQATAYFFSNSLRQKTSVLRIAALCLALCCSTYYSYIGIYNSVNSPATFLMERYVQIEKELTGIYETALVENVGAVQTAVQEAASEITAGYLELSEKKKNLESCRNALSEKGTSYADRLRAPKQSDYENYEDYVAAYSAYVAGISAGSNTEKEAGRNGILAAYGFSSMEELKEAEAENVSSLGMLAAALGLSEESDDTVIPQTVIDCTVSLSIAIEETMAGRELESSESANLNRLFQAAKVCGYRGMQLSEVQHIVNGAAEATKEPLLPTYVELVSHLEEGRVTSANMMGLKEQMDSEILTALLKTNSLLSESEQIAYSDEKYAITDLYLIPVFALRNQETKATAYFSLGVAALIDLLSVLFAISLRKQKPLWSRHTLLFCKQEDYLPQIYASLSQVHTPVQALSQFLAYFRTCPEMESDGYMLKAELRNLEVYQPLVALLCQVNMAKMVPVGLFENEEELLLLKARFVLLANSIIYENTKEKEGVSA